MRKIKLITAVNAMVGIIMISLGLVLHTEQSISSLDSISIKQFDVKNMAASTNMIVNDTKKTTGDEATVERTVLKEVEMETAPASIIIPPRVEVYEAMTMEELSTKLDRSLGGILTGHGATIASHSIEIGVDPYVVTAIMMHETGNGTSNIANNCYNFGGQKGAGCGAYKRYGSVDEGLIGMMDNLQRNYYAYGLTTVESIGSKYAESGTWPSMINMYVDRIRNA